MEKYSVFALDYPDPDVIRVENTYYMVSTTMHFFPGCEILRSQDLIHWEHATYVYTLLDSTDGQRLTEDKNIYGKGMWAASLRYHKGTYYICFVANDTGKTYLYTSKEITEPWEKSYIDGFYHDCSLLFDDDGRVYIAYGNKDIYITELKEDLSGPKEDGLHRLVVSDTGNSFLGYEGTHFYKINGKYYLFFIHSLRTEWRRVEACFVSDSLTGEFVGRDIFNEDNGYCGQGIAQGGIVDTPDGDWYAVLFQDKGAAGRMPVLLSVTWKDDFPIFEYASVAIKKTHTYEPLVQSDSFKQEKELKSCWQFNHEPDMRLCRLDHVNGIWRIRTDKLSESLTQAKNTLTQRMCYPTCTGQITVDAIALKDGDIAGLCALQGQYGMVGILKEAEQYYLVMREYTTQETEWERIPLSSPVVTLQIKVDFTNMKDEAQFLYLDEDMWKPVGIRKKIVFGLDHFCGCRFGLFLYSTKKVGGEAGFSQFIYE